jgi:hypothetical protein
MIFEELSHCNSPRVSFDHCFALGKIGYFKGPPARTQREPGVTGESEIRWRNCALRDLG